MLPATLAGIWNALGSYTRTGGLDTVLGAYDGVHRLPVELIVAILQFLPQPDLREAAGVSRDFRTAARHAGLHIQRSLRWDMGDQRFRTQLDTLRDVLQYASRYNCRVGLDFEFSVSGQDGELSSTSMLMTFRSVMTVIRDGLSWLVRLSITTSNVFFPVIYEALKDRAPHLHTFVLSWILSDAHDAPPPPVPADLFSGVAPNLCVVYLMSVPLHAIVPAFSLAREACLSFGWPWPVLPIKKHFPRVSSLAICYTEDQESPVPDFDFAGLVLQDLTIVDNLFCPLISHIEAIMPLRDIPVIQHYCDWIRWDAGESVWQTHIGPISARLQYLESNQDRLTVIIIPAHRTWRRVFHIHPAMAAVDACPLIGLDVYTILTYLRLDNRCMAGLLKLPFALEALRRLHIDFIPGHVRSTVLYPPDLERVDRPLHVSCPVLREVSLVAFEKPIAVKAIDAALLGRALGQNDRPPRERARLLLVGVTLAKPLRYALVQLEYDLQVFRSIKETSPAQHPSRKIQLADFFWDY